MISDDEAALVVSELFAFTCPACDAGSQVKPLEKS
jgi:hypothetical protein